MKYNYLLICTLLFISSCAAFKENPVLASITVSQSTARLIQASDNEEARARRIDNILTLAEGYVLNQSGATLEGVVKIIEGNIDYSKLTKADELLVKDLLQILALELQSLTKKKVKITESEIILILIRKARSTAQVYF